MKKLFVLMQYCLPHHLISRVAGYFAELEVSWFKNRLIRWFAARYKVDLTEAVDPVIEDYPSFNSFFTRALVPQARPIDHAPGRIISPADGVLSQFGEISQGKLIQAKGFDYDATSLLGGNRQWSAPFIGGKFATVYLSPRDYHRVHMPLTGQLERMVYVPGRLFSVNQTTTEYVPRLFARNERVVAIFNSDYGRFAVILVGAMVVGGIHVSWSGQITPPHGCSHAVSKGYAQDQDPVLLEKGDQLGFFNLGSTVILLFEEGMNFSFDEDLKSGMAVKVGERVAQL